jgi:hypothetical protein
MFESAWIHDDGYSCQVETSKLSVRCESASQLDLVGHRTYRRDPIAFGVQRAYFSQPMLPSRLG